MKFFAKPGDFGQIKAVYGQDLDGNVLEIQQTTPDHEFAFEKLSLLTMPSEAMD